MDKRQVFEKLVMIFGQVFHASPEKFQLDTAVDEVEQWDSLTHMQLINEVEQAFKIEFSLDQVMAIKRVSDMVEVIITKQSV